MMSKFIFAFLIAVMSAFGMPGAALAAGAGDVTLLKKDWTFSGIFGHYDKASMQRGFQVYLEVCAGCHSIE